MTKCIHCDGLGYFYNQSTFQSEHCLQCGGTGKIDEPTVASSPVEEQVSHDLGGPTLAEPKTPIGINTTTSVYNEEPVAPAPKPKKTKAKLDEVFTPEDISELTAPVDTNSGGDVDGSK